MTKAVDADNLKNWIHANEFELDSPPPEPEPHHFSLVWPALTPKIITQWFGINPQWYNKFGLPGHEGLDFRALNGVPIFAGAAGEVIRVETDPESGPYGIHVRIKHDHPEATFKSVYAHFREARVSVGEIVAAGQQIGTSDNTGNSSGAHLHITLKRVGQGSPWVNLGDIVNPVPYMPDLFPKCTIPSYDQIAWVVDVDGNFRKEPRIEDNVIRLISSGSIVEAIDVDRERGGDWWYICFEGVKGWFWNPGYKLRAL